MILARPLVLSAARVRSGSNGVGREIQMVARIPRVIARTLHGIRHKAEIDRVAALLRGGWNQSTV